MSIDWTDSKNKTVTIVERGNGWYSILIAFDSGEIYIPPRYKTEIPRAYHGIEEAENAARYLIAGRHDDWQKARSVEHTDKRTMGELESFAS